MLRHNFIGCLFCFLALQATRSTVFRLMRRVNSFLFISVEAEEENSVDALHPPHHLPNCIGFSHTSKIDFCDLVSTENGGKFWEKLQPASIMFTMTTLAGYWKMQHNILILLFLASVWFFCGFQASDTGGMHLLRHSSKWQVPYSPCWYGKMVERLSEGPELRCNKGRWSQSPCTELRQRRCSW